MPDTAALALDDTEHPPASPGPRPSQLAHLIGLAGDMPFATSLRHGGVVTEISQGSCVVEGISATARVGDIVTLEEDENQFLAQVIGIRASSVTIKPFRWPAPIRIGTRAWASGALTLTPDESWKGRTLNALGKPIDGKGELLEGLRHRRIDTPPPPPLQRERVREPISTGVNMIDVFTPLCRGQRIGVFAGSGIGKSTLMKMLSSGPGFDLTVVALVGERGREVREFLEDGSPETASRTIAVVSTSDESPMLRLIAPATAVTIAEHFRDQGQSVLLIVDSITRFAHAARDAAMASGEPPISRGYSPSVFSDITRLLERTGPGYRNTGSITGVFSVLVDGDDHDEPIADTIRGTLDGHIVLDRRIAEQGRYPAIDPIRSISRLANLTWTPDQERFVLSLRAMISRYEEVRDLRMLGGYTPGADALADQAMELVPRLYAALQQTLDDKPWEEPFRELATAIAEANAANRSR